MKTFLHELLKAAEIPHTDVYTASIYLTDPKQTTLLGLKRMLQHYGVQCKAVRTEADELKTLPYPYVLHLKDDFQIIRKAEDLTGKVLESWDGIVMYISNKNGAAEPDYRKHKRKQYLTALPYAWILLLPVVVAFLSSSHLLFNLLSLAGMLLGFLLLQKQLGETSRVGDKLCHLFQKQGCEAVLSSKRAKIIGDLSLSEVGLGYFWAQLLIAGLVFWLENLMQLLAIPALLFPLWSIYSQWRMKRWCGLCLLTQAVLLLQGLLVLYEGPRAGIGSPFFYSLLFCLTCAILLAGILAAHLAAAGLRHHQQMLMMQWKIRYTLRQPEVFMVLMQQSKRHEYQSTDVTETQGNPEAPHRVAVYLSRTCRHCLELQPRLEAFIQQQGEHFLVEKIYTDDLNEEQQQAFSERTGLTATPTILLDGYAIPVQSELEDLVYVL